MYFTKIAEVFSTALISPQTAKVQDKYQSFSYLLQIFVPDCENSQECINRYASTAASLQSAHNWHCLQVQSHQRIINQMITKPKYGNLTQKIRS